MARYNIKKLTDDRLGEKLPSDACLPTYQDVEALFLALEDCLSAASEISIQDKSTYFQYQDIMEVFNNRYDKLTDAYYEAFERIAMHAGHTKVGKRFEKLDAQAGEGCDRAWYKIAYAAVREKTLTKKLIWKKRFGF